VNDQEKLWAGDFGKAYLERNKVDPEKRTAFWQSVVDFTDPQTVLEVGCSRGHNLQALRSCGVPTVIGMDINGDAVAQARESDLLVMMGRPIMAPLFGPSFDLVFTAGLLIHISPESIAEDMRSIAAATKRYLLAVEYEADFEVEVEYRGQKRAMWKRPYGQLYGELGFKIVDTGKLGPEEGFDRTTFWLMEKA
jgi:pseudaminic acid biosynthesis-associated methylase